MQPEALHHLRANCNSAGWILLVPKLNGNDVLEHETRCYYVARPGVVLPGLEVSPADLFQNSIAQREISDQLPQPAALFLHLFETLDLIDLHTDILFTPAVVGLFSNANLAGCQPTVWPVLSRISTSRNLEIIYSG